MPLVCGRQPPMSRERERSLHCCTNRKFPNLVDDVRVFTRTISIHLLASTCMHLSNCRLIQFNLDVFLCAKNVRKPNRSDSLFLYEASRNFVQSSNKNMHQCLQYIIQSPNNLFAPLKTLERAQRLINLEIPVLVRSLK